MTIRIINVIKMRGLILIFGIMLLLFGCIDFGGGAPEEEVIVEEPKEEPVAAPSFVIVGPDEGEVLETATDYGSVEIVLSTSNLIIKPDGTSSNMVGQGHFAVSVDSEAPVHIFSKTHTLEGVEPGGHTLRIELVHNDHSSYSPAIVKTVNFYVEKGSGGYAGKDYKVTIHDFSYEPETITVAKGDRITWENKGAYPRSATYVGVFDTEVIGPGESATVTMEEAGTFEYLSLTYSAMKGTVVVE